MESILYVLTLSKLKYYAHWIDLVQMRLSNSMRDPKNRTDSVLYETEVSFYIISLLLRHMYWKIQIRYMVVVSIFHFLMFSYLMNTKYSNAMTKTMLGRMSCLPLFPINNDLASE
jgi:hypothetical protein